MRVNGVPNVRTCIAPLKEGIYVEMQKKLAELPSAKFFNETKKIMGIDPKENIEPWEELPIRRIEIL
jgi:hypothetical protein